MLSTIFGFAGAIIGFLAACLWLRASCINWNIGRQGRSLGDYSQHPGEFAGPNELDLFLKCVGDWNKRAALATAVSMLFWAAQTIADLLYARH